jgi:hypothetical protein
MFQSFLVSESKINTKTTCVSVPKV